MTKKEITAKLTEAGIEFDSKALKAELEALLPSGKYKAFYSSKGRKHYLGEYNSKKEADIALDKAGANIRYIQKQ